MVGGPSFRMLYMQPYMNINREKNLHPYSEPSLTTTQSATAVILCFDLEDFLPPGRCSDSSMSARTSWQTETHALDHSGETPLGPS
jgi:hypothetical protein